VNWWQNGYNSATGECFDIGITTKNALSAYLATKTIVDANSDPQSAGNGSIMRLAPAVLFSLNDRKAAIELAMRQSRLTHAAPEAVESCALMASILHDHITGREGATTDISEPKILALRDRAYDSKGRDD